MSCEFCSSTQDLSPYEFDSVEVALCGKCSTSIKDNNFSDINHWRCLQEAIWSEKIPVKVLAYRTLHHLKHEAWAQDLIEQAYFEEEDLKWAKAGLPAESSNESSDKVTRDSNGTELLEGDSVTLIKDLDVKGAGFTAKRGTLVKGIRLTDNPEHIEGRVSGMTIVLVAKFLKKA